MGFMRNKAGQKWRVFAFNKTTGDPATGEAANITATIDKDWAGPGATNDVNPAESGRGYYVFDLTQAETDAAVLALDPVCVTSGVGVVADPGTIHTGEARLVFGSIKTGGGRFQAHFYLEFDGAIIDVPTISVSISEAEVDDVGAVLYADGAISRQKQSDNSWIVYVDGATLIGGAATNLSLAVTFDPGGSPTARRGLIPVQ